LTDKIPIRKQLFRVGNTPTKNTVQQDSRKNTFYDNRITDGNKRYGFLPLDYMKMRRIVVAVIYGDLNPSFFAF